MTPKEKAQEYAESYFPKEIPDYNKVTRMYAEHAYLAGYNADRWIPVSERLPKDAENVLVSYADIGTVLGYRTSAGWRLFWRDGVNREDPQRPVTHWQPLPSPPTKQP